MDTNISIIKVKVFSPQKILFEGQAKAISSKNSRGKFDILPGHANFITLIEKNNLEIYKEDGKIETIPLNEAIVLTQNNIVTVYAEPVVTPS